MIEMLVEKEVILRSIPLKLGLSPSHHWDCHHHCHTIILSQHPS